MVRRLPTLHPLAAVWRTQLLRVARGAERRIEECVKDVDVVVVHGMFDPVLCWVAKTIARTGIATVAAPHDPYDDARFTERRLTKQVFWRVLERPRLAGSRLVHVLAPSHAEILRARGVDTPTMAAPNGVAAPDCPLPPQRDGRLSLAFVGRFDVYQKGLDLLIDALAQLGKRAPELCLLGRADGGGASLARMVSDRSLADRVRIIGYVPDLWPLVIAVAGALILPSRSEGFGLVAAEALVRGVPVLVSAKAGIAEWLEPDDAAIVFPPTVDGVVEAIERYASCATQLSRCARERALHVAARFAWDTVAQRWIPPLTALVRGARL
jgi:glycosyltransferase involved in cell wall biosynthesis